MGAMKNEMVLMMGLVIYILVVAIVGQTLNPPFSPCVFPPSSIDMFKISPRIVRQKRFLFRLKLCYRVCTIKCFKYKNNHDREFNCLVPYNQDCIDKEIECVNK